MISKGYNDAASKNGVTVSSSQEASLVGKEYTARNDEARFMVGAMAGKDEIKAVITYEGKTYAVED